MGLVACRYLHGRQENIRPRGCGQRKTRNHDHDVRYLPHSCKRHQHCQVGLRHCRRVPQNQRAHFRDHQDNEQYQRTLPYRPHGYSHSEQVRRTMDPLELDQSWRIWSLVQLEVFDCNSSQTRAKPRRNVRPTEDGPRSCAEVGEQLASELPPSPVKIADC